MAADKKKAKAEATTLTITLDPNGIGTLLVQRGNLATLSQFAYKDLHDIALAMQQGAENLIQLEENPPPTNLPTPATVQPALQQPTEEAAEVPDDADLDTEESDADPSGDESTVANIPLPGTLKVPEPSQMSLL